MSRSVGVWRKRSWIPPSGSVVKICTQATSVGEEGGAVATGGEDRGGAVQWRWYFPSLAAPLSVIGS
jgi:hypothetical protein